MGRASNHKPDHRETNSEYRNKLMKKLHVSWRDARPDLRHSSEELRAERLAFCEDVLGLGYSIGSMTELNNEQLGRVIDALKDQTRRMEPAGPNVRPFRRPSRAASSNGQSEPASQAGRANASAASGAGEEAEIIHLASQHQIWAINKLYSYIGWQQQRQEQYLMSKFSRRSPAMLTPRQAHSYTVILLSVAAQKDIKRANPEIKKVSREMIKAYMPELMKRVGIGQGRKG